MITQKYETNFRKTVMFLSKKKKEEGNNTATDEQIWEERKERKPQGYLCNYEHKNELIINLFMQ